nr:protein STRUBBELIG-receptor family 3-like [Tanacetum cinerariifolium]
MVSKKSKNKEDHAIDMTNVNASSFQTPILPPQPFPIERIVVKPLLGPPTTSHRTLRKLNSTKFLSMESLQVYTDSFSQENLVGSGMLATFYKAELPNGKVLQEVYQPPIVSDCGLVPLLPSCNISQPRGEQCLVRWAISQLHDIEELSGMVDPSMRAAISSKPEQEFRPPMLEIMQSLFHMIQRNL